MVRPAGALPPVGASLARQRGWRGCGTSAPNQQGGCSANGGGRVFDAGLTGGSAQRGVVDLALGRGFVVGRGVGQHGIPLGAAARPNGDNSNCTDWCTVGDN